MASYNIKNISRILMYEELDTKDVHGAKEVLRLRKRESTTLTETQWNSRVVQKHIAAGLLKSSRA